MPTSGAVCAGPSRAAIHMAASRPAQLWQLRNVHAAAVPRRRARRSLLACRAAVEEEAASAAAADARQGGEPVDALEVQKPSLMTDAWNEVVQMKKDGVVVETTVRGANKSGLLLPIGKLTGFLPYKLMDPTRLPGEDGGGSRAPPRARKELIGTTIKVKIMQVIVPEKRLIVSEKAALLDELAEMVQPGDIIEGTIGASMDWGTFLKCQTVNGQPCPHAEAVLPMREISYSWINSSTEVLSRGQAVKVVVVYRSSPPNSKVVVSLKRLEDDPLKETLDNVLPLDGEGAAYEQLSEVPASVPQGVDEILEALDREEGVTSITLGRCVEEKRTVSQDLELWITKEVVADGYHLAVRAGRLVQEVIVGTRMSPEEMRATVQRVLRSIN